ncbi:MAG TPA: thioredoxin family protein [Niabella sp.]|nr:thioredoxin family protein [Niabella sp.]HQW15540.1 thioredoxin family protein [Niabella sp.]HQX20683.1 thioredoxin family protein [Niabella sp.]HQX42512.1 thioredoxin family protein [Niabella sp.]HRB07087.1 thioredoxin family protein [Niabella sp.]
MNRKCLLLSFFLLGASLLLYSQTFENTTDRTGKRLLKGFVTDSILMADTQNFGWFGEQEKMYTPADAVIKSFAANKDSVSYMVFFGTWCADSHYLLPRFFKIIAQAGVDKSRITMFALDRTKKDAAHFADNFSIAHVPTIIVLRNGKETGRVVEYGTTGRFDEEWARIVGVQQ